jgi:NTE family protein
MASRALVLGGGGPVGIAWEAGLLAGLDEGGVRLADADFIVGTSAGSFVGAQLAMGREAGALASPIIAETPAAPRPISSNPSQSSAPDLTTLFKKMQEAMSGKRPGKEVRAEIGAWALSQKTISEEEFIAGFGRSFTALADNAWPERNYACTAVDAQSGEFVVWNKEAGVGVVRAVASSCSVPGVFPPITIKGRRYIDGGMRSATNADLAKGYDAAIVVAVTGGASNDPAMERFRKMLDNEINVVRESGARVELIVPDEASLKAFGINLMDSRRRPGAAKAGLKQGKSLAAKLKSMWSGK